MNQDAFCYSSPYGDILIFQKDGKLTRLQLQNTARDGSIPPHTESAFATTVTATRLWLDAYFSGQNPPTSALPLALSGTPFCLCIWQLLRKIPYGKVVSYEQLAKAAGEELHIPRLSAQAVGHAVGSNPLPILLPCHRVVGTNGGLTGFSAGLEWKIRLLEREGIPLDNKQKIPQAFFTALK